MGRTSTTRSGTSTSSTPRTTAPSLLYIDRHLVHEVTSPQAFEGLELAGRKVWRLSANLAVSRPQRADDRPLATASPTRSRACRSTRSTPTATASASPQFKMNDRRQGIVHVIGPEQGATLPGMTVVCGDSHTSTHGAFGALAHGIGTSEVEHVLATQTLLATQGEEHAGARRRHAAAAAAAPRTSCWRSSAGSARPAAPATRSSSRAARSARSAWKAA